MRRVSLVIGFVAATLLGAGMAHAADGKLASAVQLRAGPDAKYPSVTRLAKGLSVEVHGCLKTWDWCDVSWRGDRGWVEASAINTRADQRLPVSQVGPQLGVPEVTFQLNSYWDKNYNKSSWYGDRDTWSRYSASY